MSTEQFLLAMIYGAVMFYWGWKSREQAAIKLLEGFMSKLDDGSEEHDDERIVLTIEKEGNTFYLFEEHSERFVAQGESLADMQELIEKHYIGSGKNVVIRQKDAEDSGLL